MDHLGDFFRISVSRLQELCSKAETRFPGSGSADQLMPEAGWTDEAILILNRPYLIEGFASKLDFTEPA
jgi:hypothetical protein|tara:strand:- start:2613 stop:2819 length:207 start_codon:yes stop_codon:yes gene_type:complete